MKEKLLTGALALCLAAGVAPIEELAEEVSSGFATENVTSILYNHIERIALLW